MKNQEPGSPMVTVHVSWVENEAELIQSMLSADGIESRLSHFSQAPYPTPGIFLGRIEINVDPENVERALKLIEADSTN